MKWLQCSSSLILPRIFNYRSMSVFGTSTSDVLKAARLLNYGKVIAVPTDTVYGLAGLAQDIVAVEKLYKIKGRACMKPLAICVGNIDDISLWGDTDNLPAGLLSSLLPGPVTIVLNRTSRLNPSLNPTTKKVGIRIPNHSFIQEISKLLESPLALTSANRSNEPSCLQTQEFENLWPQLAGVFDGGVVGNFRSGSTVVDLTDVGVYQILRAGSALDYTKKVLESYNLEQSFVDVLCESNINSLSISH